MSDSTQLATIKVPGTAATLRATEIDGAVWVSLRHACEALGIAFSSQRVKLSRREWAVVSSRVTTGADGKSYEMTLIDRRTFIMWLASIGTGRIAPEARPAVVAFQEEAANALEAYFTKGAAVNPRMAEEPAPAPAAPAVPAEYDLERAVRLARAQLELLKMAEGMVSSDFIAGKAKIVLARGLGEKPELAATEMPLYVYDYLTSRGVPARVVRQIGSQFGKAVAQVYRGTYGSEPEKAVQEIDGRAREVNFYTVAHRPIFDAVWDSKFATVTAAVTAAHPDVPSLEIIDPDDPDAGTTGGVLN